jgi:hypothetical protein
MISVSKKQVGVIALGASMLSSVLGGVARADLRDFYFVNIHPSAAIVGAWIAPAGERDEPWQTITIYSPIRAGHKSKINFGSGIGCMYDVKVHLSNGTDQLFTDTDLCRTLNLIVT